MRAPPILPCVYQVDQRRKIHAWRVAVHAPHSFWPYRSDAKSWPFASGRCA